jgi:hypothetical protein
MKAFLRALEGGACPKLVSITVAVDVVGVVGACTTLDAGPISDRLERELERRRYGLRL